jgi:cytochrome b561
MESALRDRYSAPVQLLHWLTAVLVLIAFLYGSGGSEQRVYSAARDVDRQLHETFGVAVFALVVVRVLWRATGDRPEPPAVARWMELAGKIVQDALVVLLVAIPLTAITGAWLEGHPLTLLTGMRVPPAIAESHALGETIARVHTWLGDTLMWVAGCQALAGVYHHFILRDGVLKSMLPRRGLSDRDGA